MLPTTIIICGLAAAPPATMSIAELLERAMNLRHFDDMMLGYERDVIDRLEAKLEWAKKNRRPQAEIHDLQEALAVWRKGGTPGFRNQPDAPQPTNPFDKPSTTPEPPKPVHPPAEPNGADAIGALQIVIERAKQRGEPQGTIDYYQKLLDELREKHRKR